MAWRQSGDKPLSKPRLVSLLTHICVARPQWVDSCISVLFSSSYSNSWALIQYKDIVVVSVQAESWWHNTLSLIRRYICTSSNDHHQLEVWTIHYQLFKVKSWKSGTQCMFYFIYMTANKNLQHLLAQFDMMLHVQWHKQNMEQTLNSQKYSGEDLYYLSRVNWQRYLFYVIYTSYRSVVWAVSKYNCICKSAV